ncbi:hypothetical protein MNBD_ALPHA04-810 [hydrothermal vent metagenome]|uniref:DUF4402 domain-containing protein n=1 Tax=hydrothermal vent metagenome TaxID=652676 RepID=A0A3B0RHW2_9ZZZZ
MSKFIKAALASSVLAASVMGANAAHAATASADARANILAQVSVTSDGSDLDFATIVTGAAASTVVVASDGTLTCGTGLVCSGTATAAGFTVSGTTGQTVDVSSDASVTLSSGANTMSATLAPSVTSIVLDGTDAFSVGGTLSVAANQADGAYTGTFNVTVDYQ